jgi:hypothetical protein
MKAAAKPQHKYGLRRERVPQLKRFASYAPEFVRQHAGDAGFKALPPLPKLVDLRPKCPPPFNQGDIGSCHDPATEVLTRDGWKLFAELTGNEQLASVDPASARLTYEKPTRLVRLPFDGELVVGSGGHSLDFKVTPNHKMLVREWDEAKKKLKDAYTFVSAEDIGCPCGLMSRVVWKGEPSRASETYVLPGGPEREDVPRSPGKALPMSAWLQFLGICLAEGRLCPAAGPRTIQIAAGEEPAREYLRKLSAELGLRFLESAGRFACDDGQICEELARLGMTGADPAPKSVPAFVFEQSAENIGAFLLGRRMGGSGAEQDGRRSHRTSSAALADDLQRLAFLSGGAGDEALGIGGEASVTRERYTGDVFCAEVPTYHTLVTRRNRRILISGNCTANALVYVYAFDNPGDPLSRLFLYFNERELDGCVDNDEGSTLSTGIRALQRFGICLERLWPYDTAKWKAKPPVACYEDAKGHAVVCSAQVHQNTESMKACLASGEPIALGIQIYQSFESQRVAKTGLVEMPKPQEPCFGGHAVVCVGYDDARQLFFMANSWGPEWGDRGFFYLPYAYLTDQNLTCDLWTITKTSEAFPPSPAPTTPLKATAPSLGLDLLERLRFLRTVKILLCDVPPPDSITAQLVESFMREAQPTAVSQATPQCPATLVCQLLAAVSEPTTPLGPGGEPLVTQLIGKKAWPSSSMIIEEMNDLLARVGLKAEIVSVVPASAPEVSHVTFALKAASGRP